MDPRFTKLPITELSSTARQVLSLNLNVLRDLGNKDGIPCDVRGVVDLRGFPSKYSELFLQKDDPTAAVLKEWNSLGLASRGSSVQTLLDILETLDRRDILEELKPGLELSWSNYENYLNWLKNEDDCTQVARVSSSNEDCHMTKEYIPEERFLSKHDTPDHVANFDVFISCTGRRDDLKFAEFLVDKLEREHGLTCFLKERDGIVSGSKYTVYAHLIEKRCRKFVVLISRAFVQSAECLFQVRFAQCLSPGAHAKRIIPVVVEEGARVDPVLRPISPLDWSRDDLRKFFWDRLVSTIRLPTSCSSDDVKGDLDNLSLCGSDTESWVEGTCRQ